MQWEKKAKRDRPRRHDAVVSCAWVSSAMVSARVLVICFLSCRFSFTPGCTVVTCILIPKPCSADSHASIPNLDTTSSSFAVPGPFEDKLGLATSKLSRLVGTFGHMAPNLTLRKEGDRERERKARLVHEQASCWAYSDTRRK